MNGTYSTREDLRIAYKILARKPQGKRPPGRIGYIWESNIRVELKDICCYAVEWI